MGWSGARLGGAEQLQAFIAFAGHSGGERRDVVGIFLVCYVQLKSASSLYSGASQI